MNRRASIRSQLAIVASARERGLQLETAREFDSVTGQGVHGAIGGRRVALGNAKLMQDEGADIAPLTAIADRLRATGAAASSQPWRWR